MASPMPLFVYGTLLDPEVRAFVLGRRPDLETLRARLPGYRRSTESGFGYPFLVRAEEDAVDGMLIVGLTEADYALLDEYEDIGDATYERVRAQVDLLGCGTDKRTWAWVYARPEPLGQASP
ncbi:MAG TPA: gamma-glutamylcyclotransferase family protein [Chloroflexota bacterium]|nr:gamma-glutamylcyclotransferase family protein [Chloroflexota bacterium]